MALHAAAGLLAVAPGPHALVRTATQIAAFRTLKASSRQMVSKLCLPRST